MTTAPFAIGDLRRWVTRHTPREGAVEGPYPGLVLYRFTRRTAMRKQPILGVSFCVGLQGHKQMRVGETDFSLEHPEYLVVTRETSFDSTLTPASATRPFLSLSLTFSPELVAKALGVLADERAAPSREIAPAYAASMTRTLSDALSRFVRAVDDPIERRTLAPLAAEELVFRLLRSDAAAAMRSALRAEDCVRITDAMRLMRANAAERLSVGAIARQVAMSPSHFAHRFRAIARMSPMRYVKEVRLEQARTLLLGERARASDVAVRVGYESASHFTRDFKRRFGVPPGRYAEYLDRV